MSSVSNIVPVAEFFRSNPEAKQVFNAIARSSSISGWALIKEVSVGPDDLQNLLSDLQSRGLIKADGAGLDAFFYPTDLGFRYSTLAT